MKIGVIGTFNRDTIKLPDRKIKHGWGGIFYNILALSKLIGKRDEIYPVANVGYDAYKTVIGFLKKIRGVRLDYLNKVREKNNHCFLTYSDYEQKSEILKGGVGPLKYENIQNLLDNDLILLNYISGRDIYFRSLRKLRRNYPGKIYIDIHSLTLGKYTDGRRYFRCPPRWMSVVECGDYIQMNRMELDLLVSTRKLHDKKAKSVEIQLRSLVKILEKKGIRITEKVIIITVGESGCILYYYSGNRWRIQDIPTRKKAGGGDTTGCGDCFSAGFISGIIKSKSLCDCAKMGNRIASEKFSKNLQISGMRNT